MTNNTQDDLLAAVEELRTIFPEWRLGQLVANLATAAGATESAGIWDVEDEQLLGAARRLLERNKGRIAAVPEPAPVGT